MNANAPDPSSPSPRGANSAPAAQSLSTAPITPLDITHSHSTPLGLLIVGGSFDPPHRWHTHIAESARQWLSRENPAQTNTGKVDWHTLFVPAAHSPLKTRGPIAPDADRLALLRLAIAPLPNTHIWTDELDRAAYELRTNPNAHTPSYTLDTLTRLATLFRAAAHPDQPPPTLRLLIGTDQALSFHRWHEPRRIIALAPPIVLLRPPVATRADLRAHLVETGFWSATELDRWEDSTLIAETNPVSSTDLRAHLADPTTHAEVLNAPEQFGLTPAVAREIARRNLYGTPTNPPPNTPQKP